VNWNLPSGLLITTSFMSNGRIQSTTQNRMGMSFMLRGVYQFNAAQSPLMRLPLEPMPFPTDERA
jgi:hypothetical protein